MNPSTRQLLEIFAQTPWFAAFSEKLNNRLAGNASHAGLNDFHLENLMNPSVKAMLVAGLFDQLKQPIVLICPDPQIAAKFQFELSQFLPDEAIALYPAEDFSPYDLSVFPVHALKQQYAILKQLQAGTPFVLILSTKNLLLKHMALKEMEAHAIDLAVDMTLSPEALTENCLALGYVKTSIVMDAGEFSRRGDIFDLYPVNNDPVRIEFLGDTIENIRLIDVDNQRSVGQTKTVNAIPRAGLVLSDENREKLPQLLNEKLVKQKVQLSDVESEGLEMTLSNQIQALEQAFQPDGIDYYAPLLHEHYCSIIDYLPAKTLVVMDDWHMLENNLAGLSDRLSNQVKDGIAKGRLLDLDFYYHLSDAEALTQLKAKSGARLFIETLPVAADGQPALTPSGDLSPLPALVLEPPPVFKADVAKAAESFLSLRRKQVQIFITTDHPQRVLDLCKEWDVPAIYWHENSAAETLAQSVKSLDVVIAKNGLQEGFVLPELKLAHFTDTELYSRRMKRMLTAKKKPSKRDDIDVINSIHDLRMGDYVVHQKHGIGQFVELTSINIDGEKREYLSIQYASSDKLHVPIDQLNLLSRYRGAGDKAPKLSKMGGAEWSRVKSKVKKSIQVIAKDLMALYAARAKAKGHIFDTDSPWQVEMEEAFPYTETPDQWQAILDTKKDMETEKPMDRLICGDVGFGKTEVAIRAIFKCILSGKQAAILVPTTILAQQHFNTLVERLAPYPMRVGLLSRFRSPQEQKDVIQRLSRNECDVVVGTHRLLQKDIKFSQLGLVVIDEEQRFGVAHKEKMKHLKTEVDVLTLSATPIPRTLYMSLSGIREMSLINTPPVNRAPIKTFVGPYNPSQIRMAILQEIDRGGQVYFLHNRVQTIYAKLEELQNLIPEVRFNVGHGQMNERDLENVMLDFAQRQFDVLLCTTIIESGLDIPSANTIVIDRADRFGLAQLYQIRGRVGRSNIQAYAYCYYDPERNLTQDAKDRLRAIREFSSLGSGYQIAMRDLEIRGVGNVLGSEQHGHMVAVGFDLYCQMLEESIQELQTGEVAEEKETTVIDINVTALIPEDWVGDRDVKLMEYKRLASVNSELSVEIIEAEWKDRFGEIPGATKMLMNLIRIRIMAAALNIPQVRTDDDVLKITVPFSLQEWMYLQRQLPDKLAKKARWVPGVASRQGSQPVLVIKLLGMSGEEQVAFLMDLFPRLQKLIEKVPAGSKR
ncbi:MAG: transcription-repair coupling factor [Cyanobacteria bacterium P01_H01_bin.74]